MPIVAVQERLSKNANLLLVLLLIYVAIRGVAGAVSKPLTIDEILTQIVATQPGLKGIWAALMSSVDSPPPVFYLIERVALNLVTNVHIALRIPSILAIPCAIACLFIYIKKRDGVWPALLCSFLLLSTAPYRYFLDIARPYSMIVACFAFALLCYQRVPAVMWTTLLGLSLALAQGIHYYAILAMLPFWLAEASVLLSGRKFRLGVWLALILGASPLLFFWPILSAFKAYYGGHYWEHFAVGDLARVYGSFFWTSTNVGVGIAAVALTGVIGPRLWSRFVDSTSSEAPTQNLAEDLLVLGLLGLPFIAFVATRLLHGEMLDRHILPSILGVILGLARIFSRASARVIVVLAIFILSGVGAVEMSFWRTVHALRPTTLTAQVEEFAQSAGHSQLPVVVSSGLTYLPLVYYASPAWKHRFVFVEDSQKALNYAKTDNVDKALRSLVGYFPLEIKGYSEFISSHPSFLLYEDASPGFEWLPLHLTHVGAALQVVAMKQNQTMYLVTMKPGN
jgi:hypothetical protein